MEIDPRMRHRVRETDYWRDHINHTRCTCGSFLESYPLFALGALSHDATHGEALVFFITPFSWCVTATDYKMWRMSVRRWGASRHTSHTSGPCPTFALWRDAIKSFPLVWLCEDSHTPSTDGTEVSDSDTAVITHRFILRRWWTWDLTSSLNAVIWCFHHKCCLASSARLLMNLFCDSLSEACSSTHPGKNE